MEGILLIPPDRATIIGRALWKPRYIIIGDPRDGQQHSQTNSTMSRTFNNRSQSSRSAGPREPPLNPSLSERSFLFIYKSKSDTEPIQQHAISSLIDCQVQMVAHRKQGPVLPTLVINAAPDPAAEKLRKRRSSRTGGLTNSKEKGNTTLWFRPGDDVHALHDWSSCIQSLMQTTVRSNPLSPTSPATPGSPTFINPFAVSRTTTTTSSTTTTTRESSSDYYSRPGSGNPNQRSVLNHKPSTQTYSSREQPTGFSDAPSLRSRRSDLSHSSSMNPAHMGFTMGHGFTSGHPADLPSPTPTTGAYQGEFIEGWTSAQGRSSILSSPIRGRDSVGSQAPVPQHAVLNSSSPPMPRETILDRAFQLRCIPGSEQEIPGEDKLSSIARFDALMREVDAKRKTSIAETKPTPNESSKSAWDLDEESEEDSNDEAPFEEDNDANRYGNPVFMPHTAQRALDFIASRHTSPRPSRVQSPVNGIDFNTESFRAMNSGYSHLGPRTAFPKDRPAMAQRTHSQPQLAATSSLTTTLEVPSPARTVEEATSGRTSTAEKRLSSSSTKRLSFTEFTKRLSSTSSLLMIQTNTSGGASSRGSSEQEGSQTAATPKGSIRLRGVTSPGPGSRDRCGIRGSVLGAEGGFL